MRDLGEVEAAGRGEQRDDERPGQGALAEQIRDGVETAGDGGDDDATTATFATSASSA